jgi:spore coat polysaccharide biosynthesis protein SpsF
MKTVAIIQARMGSSRLPGKVLRTISGKPMLEHILERVRAVKEIDQVIVATSNQPIDKSIQSFCEKNQIDYFAGNEHNVLDRFYHAAIQYSADNVLRITADCPLVDPAIITSLIHEFTTDDYDYFSVATGASAIFLDGGRFPDGYDAEYMRMPALAKAWREATALTDREHVTPYLWRQPELFKLGKLKSAIDYSALRLTVDNEDDFRLIDLIYQDLYRPDQHFLLADVIRWLEDHPDLAATNRQHIGQEGYEALWQPVAA